MGEIAGWISVGLGQLVSWPQLLKLRHERGEGISLLSYGIVLVSMSLFFIHAVGIRDAVAMVSVPLSIVPNVVIAVTLLRRRLTNRFPRRSPGADASTTKEGTDEDEGIRSSAVS